MHISFFCNLLHRNLSYCTKIWHYWEYAIFPLNWSVTPLCPFVSFIPSEQCRLVQTRFFTVQHTHWGHRWCAHKVGTLLPYIIGEPWSAIFHRSKDFANKTACRLIFITHNDLFHIVLYYPNVFFLTGIFINDLFTIASRPQKSFPHWFSYVCDVDNQLVK